MHYDVHVSDGLWGVHAEKNMWIQEREAKEWYQMQNGDIHNLYSSTAVLVNGA